MRKDAGGGTDTLLPSSRVPTSQAAAESRAVAVGSTSRAAMRSRDNIRCKDNPRTWAWSSPLGKRESLHRADTAYAGVVDTLLGLGTRLALQLGAAVVHAPPADALDV